MAAIAREAGISKALLYHYFPSKQEFFRATLAQAADELRSEIEPDAALPGAEQLSVSLDRFLTWIDGHRDAYAKLLHTALTVDDVRSLVDAQRDATSARILAGALPPDADDALRARARVAAHGWLWFMDGACLDWIEHDDLDRAALHGLLLGTLLGALTAAGVDLRDVVGGQAPEGQAATPAPATTCHGDVASPVSASVQVSVNSTSVSLSPDTSATVSRSSM